MTPKAMLTSALDYLIEHDRYTHHGGGLYRFCISDDYKTLVEHRWQLPTGTIVAAINDDGEIITSYDKVTPDDVYDAIFYRVFCCRSENMLINQPKEANSLGIRSLKGIIMSDHNVPVKL